MVLLLLVSLALLLWMVQGELSADATEAPLPANCPACQAEIGNDWLVCPHCQSRLRESCTGCHKSKQIGQPYCPFCGDGTEKKVA